MPQIVHDATASHTEAPASPDTITTFTWNHTVGTGDGRYLKVGLMVHNTDDITSVKYAGELLEPLDINPIIVADKYLYYYWMAAPAVGTNQVEVVFGTGQIQVHGISSSYFLVDQFVPHGTIVTSTAGAAAGAIDSDIVLEEGGLGVDLLGVDSTANASADAGQTERAQVGTSPGSGYGGDQTASGASDEGGGPGTITMGWTFSSDDASGHIAVPLRPMSAARARVYEYHENVHMSRAAGLPLVRDAQGRQVKAEQLRANNYVRVEGPHMISTNVYDDAAEDPALIFAEHVGVRGRSIVLTPSKETTAARILGKLTRR